MNLVAAAPAFSAAFLASLVECVEALTVVLAVGAARGWRDALAGSAAALAVLLVIVALPGHWLQRVPLHTLQLVIGALLLALGLRWLRKAILRTAGALPQHDEASIYARRIHALSTGRPARSGFDREAFSTAFKITALEGSEVVFIVIAVDAQTSQSPWAASLGALAALIVVVALGAMIRGPLTRVPENALKFVVGVLLGAFGCFWVGEGLGIAWPGGDWAIVGLIIAAWATAAVCVRWVRRATSVAPS